MGGPSSLVRRFASGLRFPQLFMLAALLFILDLLIPDLIPGIDEALLALATIALGTWKDRREQPKPPTKDVTPRHPG